MYYVRMSIETWILRYRRLAGCRITDQISNSNESSDRLVCFKQLKHDDSISIVCDKQTEVLGEAAAENMSSDSNGDHRRKQGYMIEIFHCNGDTPAKASGSFPVQNRSIFRPLHCESHRSEVA